MRFPLANDNRTWVSRAAWIAAALLVLASLALVGCKQFPIGEQKPSPEVVAGSKALQGKNEAQAVAQFDSAIKKSPTSIETYAFIMRACRLANQPDLLKQYYLKGLEATKGLKPEERVALLVDAAGEMSMLDMMDDAISAADEAVKAQRGNWRAENALGYFYADVGKNPERAVELTADAVRHAKAEGVSDSELGETAVDSLGWAYYKAGMLNEAVRTLEKAVSLSPGRAELHLHLGIAYHAKGRDEDAKIELVRAKASLPSSAEMGKAKEKLQKAIAQTLEEVQEAIDRNKDKKDKQDDPQSAVPAGPMPQDSSKPVQTAPKRPVDL